MNENFHPTAYIPQGPNRRRGADIAARALGVHEAQSARVVGAVRRGAGAVHAGADVHAAAVDADTGAG